jgi:hypothetical protein
MTDLQKDTIEKLLLGYTIASSGRNGFRLRTQDAIVIRKINPQTFHSLKPLLRRNKDLFVINKNAVRQLHGNSWIKRTYTKKLTLKN